MKIKKLIVHGYGVVSVKLYDFEAGYSKIDIINGNTDFWEYACYDAEGNISLTVNPSFVIAIEYME